MFQRVLSSAGGDVLQLREQSVMFRGVFTILPRRLQAAAAPLPYLDVMLDELLEQVNLPDCC